MEQKYNMKSNTTHKQKWNTEIDSLKDATPQNFLSKNIKERK